MRKVCRPRVLSSLATLLALATAVVRADAEPLVPVSRFELANGMRFEIVTRPRALDVAAGWMVDSGTADDPEGHVGLAHMLEHLMFQGTGTIRPGELDRLYAEAGATGLDALTRRDFSAFYVTLPAERVELWFWLESDRLADARFRDLDRERDAILEERHLRVEATPTGELEEEASRAFWGSSPYARPNTGLPDDLAALTLDEVRARFEERFRPENLTAVLVGPVTEESIRPLAELYFGRLVPAPGPRPAAPGTGEPGAGVETSTQGSLEAPVRRLEPLRGRCDCRPRVQLSYPAPAFASPEAATAEVLVALLNGRSGRLHTSLVLGSQQAFAAYARHTRLRHAGRLTLVAEAREEASLAHLAGELRREAERLGSSPVSAYELTKAKNRLTANTLRRLERPSELMLELLFHQGLGRGDHFDHWLGEVGAVTSADIRLLAGRIFQPEREVEALFERRTSTPEPDS